MLGAVDFVLIVIGGVILICIIIVVVWQQLVFSKKDVHAVKATKAGVKATKAGVKAGVRSSYKGVKKVANKSMKMGKSAAVGTQIATKSVAKGAANIVVANKHEGVYNATKKNVTDFSNFVGNVIQIPERATAAVVEIAGEKMKLKRVSLKGMMDNLRKSFPTKGGGYQRLKK